MTLLNNTSSLRLFQWDHAGNHVSLPWKKDVFIVAEEGPYGIILYNGNKYPVIATVRIDNVTVACEYVMANASARLVHDFNNRPFLVKTGEEHTITKNKENSAGIISALLVAVYPVDPQQTVVRKRSREKDASSSSLVAALQPLGNGKKRACTRFGRPPPRKEQGEGGPTAEVAHIIPSGTVVQQRHVEDEAITIHYDMYTSAVYHKIIPSPGGGKYAQWLGSVCQNTGKPSELQPSVFPVGDFLGFTMECRLRNSSVPITATVRKAILRVFRSCHIIFNDFSVEIIGVTPDRTSALRDLILHDAKIDDIVLTTNKAPFAAFLEEFYTEQRVELPPMGSQTRRKPVNNECNMPVHASAAATGCTNKHLLRLILPCASEKVLQQLMEVCVSASAKLSALLPPTLALVLGVASAMCVNILFLDSTGYALLLVNNRLAPHPDEVFALQCTASGADLFAAVLPLTVPINCVRRDTAVTKTANNSVLSEEERRQSLDYAAMVLDIPLLSKLLRQPNVVANTSLDLVEGYLDHLWNYPAAQSLPPVYFAVFQLGCPFSALL